MDVCSKLFHLSENNHIPICSCPKSALSLLVCIKLSSTQLHINACGRSGHCHCAARCSRGAKSPLSQEYIENK